MNEMQRIEDLLKRAHGGDAWHGPSVQDVLRGVNAKLAASRPPAGLHTIWEIVLHLIAWNRAVFDRVQGKRVRLGKTQDWPSMPAPSAAAWHDSLAQLELSHRQLLSAIHRLPDRDLTRKTGSRRRDTVYENLLGTAQHYTYHAGQIMLLKRIAKAPS
jgi:uncharacterized damage-inducible protein DinB